MISQPNVSIDKPWGWPPSFATEQTRTSLIFRVKVDGIVDDLVWKDAIVGPHCGPKKISHVPYNDLAVYCAVLGGLSASLIWYPVLAAFPFPGAFPLVFARGRSSSDEDKTESSEEKSPKDISSSCLEAIGEFDKQLYDRSGLFVNAMILAKTESSKTPK